MNKEIFGWLMYDFANSAFATIILATLLPFYFIRYVAPNEISFYFLGFKFTSYASALWGYAISISMLLVALFAPILGTISDFYYKRKRFLFSFCYLGCILTSLLYFVEIGDYWLAIFLFISANMAFALGNVFYNAFLKDIVSEKEMDLVSGKGFAYGYFGGGILLLFSLLIISKYKSFGLSSQIMAIRIIFIIVAIWWAVFSIPTFIFLKEKKGSIEHYDLSTFFQTLKKIKHFKEALKFLIAFFFYNEGIQTVIALATIFVTNELLLDEITLIEVLLFIQFISIPTTILWGKIAKKIGTKKALIVILSLWLGIILYAYIMKRILEFWILGGMVGCILGGTQALSRSFYTLFIPKKHSAEFFGFYTISHKFAAIIGPFSFGLIHDITGNLRYSILFIAIFFILGIIILITVNDKKLIRSFYEKDKNYYYFRACN
ncbi:MAG: MFS transporter [Candidatus Desulfofervidus auxilii]|nr:MFS transporter [Candidatus Desulfofervidus auxilii]